MAKCNQLTRLPFKGLSCSLHAVNFDFRMPQQLNLGCLCYCITEIVQSTDFICLTMVLLPDSPAPTAQPTEVAVCGRHDTN